MKFQREVPSSEEDPHARRMFWVFVPKDVDELSPEHLSRVLCGPGSCGQSRGSALWSSKFSKFDPQETLKTAQLITAASSGLPPIDRS